MNILLLLFFYFMLTMSGTEKKKNILDGLNMENLTPLLSLFSGGKLDISALLKSDLIKNINFMGIDMSKILPIIEVFNNLKGSGIFGGSGGQSTSESKKEEEPPAQKQSYPLSPISDIADKNITYSLSQYLANH